jgi:chloride channel protein, CIC family
MEPAAPAATPTPRQYLRTVALSAVVGIPAALVAALFLAAVHYLQHWLWVDLPDAVGEAAPPWYLVIGLPVVGAAIVLLARLWLPGDGGHEPLDGLSMAPTPIAHVPGIVLAALATLSFGAVLGPEAPVVALGGAIALFLTARARLGERESSLLSLAGSFAALSALFGGPLVGGVFLMESAVGLGAQAIPALLPGFVAAAVGYLVFIGFGDWGGLEAPGLVVPSLPLYDGTYLVDLVLAVVVGVVAALAIVPLKRRAARLEELGKARLGMPGLLLAGGLAVGLLAVAADLLGADSQDVLFSGQAAIPALLAETSTSVVLVLLVAKAIAYAISLASGFRGGPIFPAIFLGIGIATFPVIWFDMSPTVALAMGAAAGMAAQSRLLLSSMLLASLLVGSQGADAVPAAVLAAAAAWLTATALERHPAAPEQVSGSSA